MKKAPMLFVVKNLKWLMGEKISPYALASATGVPQPTIFRILTGESDDPRTKTLLPLATYFGVTVAQLRDMDLAKEEGGQIYAENASSSGVDNVQNLDAREREWLGLLKNLGSDDISEFSTLIKARQERNIRFIQELGSYPSEKTREISPSTLIGNMSGKKQRSQSS